MPKPYPLSWPPEQPRTPVEKRRASRFRTTLYRAQRHLLSELEHIGARSVILSSDMPVRNDGGFYSGAREPHDPGVAVHFQWRGRPYAIGCDAYDLMRENLRALGKTIEAMRAIERHGATSLLARAVSGFAALPPGEAPPPPTRPWWEVFGMPTDGPMSAPDAVHDKSNPMRGVLLQAVEATWKRLCFESHPDKGGDPEAMAEANRAIAEARQQLGERED